MFALGGLATIVEVFVDVVSRILKLLIDLCRELLRGEDALEVACVLRLPVVPLALFCGFRLLLLLLSDFGLAVDGPTLELESLLLLELHLLEK